MTITSNRTHLLYIGNDPELTKASSGLLRTAGYRVRSTNPTHVGEALRECRYAAVIFCATLSGEEMNGIVEIVSALQSHVPIIGMQVGLLGDGPHPACSLVVDALQGPNAFIGAVRSVTVYHQKVS